MNRIEINVETGEQTVIDITEEEIAKLQADENARINSISYAEKRRQEYPDFREYLDGVVKNDQVQIQKYIDDCNAVKNKYPKP
jgi:hypothetical protein